MPGKLVNTNELLVLLGDNWFAEKSAKQACDMIDRRLVSIDAYIDEVNKEIAIYQDQIKWTENLMSVRINFKEMLIYVF